LERRMGTVGKKGRGLEKRKKKSSSEKRGGQRGVLYTEFKKKPKKSLTLEGTRFL